MGWRSEQNRDDLVEADRKAAFAALPPRVRFLIRAEQWAFAAAFVLLILGVVLWKTLG